MITDIMKIVVFNGRLKYCSVAIYIVVGAILMVTRKKLYSSIRHKHLFPQTLKRQLNVILIIFLPMKSIKYYCGQKLRWIFNLNFTG